MDQDGITINLSAITVIIMIVSDSRVAIFQDTLVTDTQGTKDHDTVIDLHHIVQIAVPIITGVTEGTNSAKAHSEE